MKRALPYLANALLCLNLLPSVYAIEAEQKSEITLIQDSYSLAKQFREQEQWHNLLVQTNNILITHPDNLFADECMYLLGEAHFHLGEIEKANRDFSVYLEQCANPKHFFDVIQYKFQIAEKFRGGKKAHLFGSTSLPRWAPGKSLALSIYDEVIAALPNAEITPAAHFGKAWIQSDEGNYRESIETFEQLIRKFPRDPLAAEAYVAICKVYLNQCKKHYADPNYLELAEINYKKFKTALPSDENLQIAEETLNEMREIYAKDLYETAQFFERTKKSGAAKIYYTKLLAKFPNTSSAEKSQQRLPVVEKLIAKQEAKKAKLEAQQANLAKIEAEKAKAEATVESENQETVQQEMEHPATTLEVPKQVNMI